jgi:hypothetical protein
LPPEASLEADPRLGLKTTETPGQYRLTIDAPEPRYLLARLGEGGPILAQTRVDGFRLYSAGETDFEVVQTLEDGTQRIAMGLVLTPVLPQPRVEVSLVVGGVVFVDGTVVKSIQPNDWNALGEYNVSFLRPAAAKTSVCHKTKAYQVNNFLGQR